MSRIAFFLIIIATFIFNACGERSEEPVMQTLSPQDAFFETVSALCGQSFIGEGTYPTDQPDHELIDVELRLIVESCTDDEIRMPLHAGDDRSRTWVITKTEDGLLLKHDHRYPDGTPHDLTNYGGYANDEGSAFRQYFEADQETAEMLPEASTNVWMMDVSISDQVLTYYLERHDEPRFRAEIDLSQTVR